MMHNIALLVSCLLMAGSISVFAYKTFFPSNTREDRGEPTRTEILAILAYLAGLVILGSISPIQEP